MITCSIVDFAELRNPALDRSSNHYAEALHLRSPTSPLIPRDCVFERDKIKTSIQRDGYSSLITEPVHDTSMLICSFPCAWWERVLGVDEEDLFVWIYYSHC